MQEITFMGLAAATESVEPHCCECYGPCETMFVWKDSYVAIECDNWLEKHHTDDEGFTDFVCPNGCRLNPEYSEAAYTWKASGEPVGCGRCIVERDAWEGMADGA